MLQLLQRVFGWGEPAVADPPDGRQRVTGQWLRLPWDGRCYALELGEERLLLMPERRLDERDADGRHPLVVVNPDLGGEGLPPRLRVGPGERVTLSQEVSQHRLLFDDPRTIGRRGVEIRHAGTTVLLRDWISEAGTWVEPSELPEGLEARREATLVALEDLYGGPIAPLDPATAMDRLTRCNELLRSGPCRTPDAEGNPGAIVDLPPDVAPVLVGDLHGLVDNLLTVLSIDGLLEGLARGDTALILLGDTVHREDHDELAEMGSSLLMTDLIIQLKLAFPDRFFMLLGNHESFLPVVMKGGIPQGLLWRQHVTETRGPTYADALACFYELSPIIAASEHFLSCHAAPARGRLSREVLVNVRSHPEKLHQLISDRARTPGYPAGYGKSDVKRFRKAMGTKSDAPFVVGHFPRSREHSIALDVDKVEGHHILFSALHHEVGVFAQVRGQMVPQVYAAQPVLRWLAKHASGRRQTVS